MSNSNVKVGIRSRRNARNHKKLWPRGVDHGEGGGGGRGWLRRREDGMEEGGWGGEEGDDE